jgi:hypothetical protein
MWSKIAAAPPSQAAVKQGVIQKPPPKVEQSVNRGSSKPVISVQAINAAVSHYQSNLFFPSLSQPHQPQSSNPTPTPQVQTPITDAQIPQGLSKNARRKLRKQQKQTQELEVNQTPPVPVTQSTQESAKPADPQPIKSQSQIFRGILNTGNICFLSTCLQVLLACAPMYSLFEYLSKYQIPAKYQKLSAL